MNENQFYVYVLLDPRKPGEYKYGEYEFDHEPFYVGKGKGNRLNEHVWEAEKYLHEEKTTILIECKNPHKVNKIIKIYTSTSKWPESVLIVENMSEEDAFQLEINLILEIGRFGLKAGPLTNLTGGGEGTSGYIFTDEEFDKAILYNDFNVIANIPNLIIH